MASKTKTKMLYARATPADERRFREHAARHGARLSTWIRALLVAATEDPSVARAAATVHERERGLT